MSAVPISQQVKLLERYIYNLPAARKLNMLKSDPREAMINLRTAITTARNSVAMYSNSDDTEEQAKLLEEGILQLGKVQNMILKASEYDLLDTADVAHLSAMNEQITEKLK